MSVNRRNTSSTVTLIKSALDDYVANGDLSESTVNQ